MTHRVYDLNAAYEEYAEMVSNSTPDKEVEEAAKKFANKFTGTNDARTMAMAEKAKIVQAVTRDMMVMGLRDQRLKDANVEPETLMLNLFLAVEYSLGEYLTRHMDNPTISEAGTILSMTKANMDPMKKIVWGLILRAANPTLEAESRKQRSEGIVPKSEMDDEDDDEPVEL